MLNQAVYEESEVEYRKAVCFSFGSFEQGAEGAIRGGKLYEHRRQSFIDLMMVMRPFERWEEEANEPPPATQEEAEKALTSEREKFLQEYKEWTEKGGPVVAKHLKY